MEKIDIINEIIYVYDENMKLIKTIGLDVLGNLDLAFLDGCKLLTINISQPTKRVIKFSELQDINSNAVFVEILYENMTPQQSMEFDNLITTINSLI